jgi:hypothetical protein
MGNVLAPAPAKLQTETLSEVPNVVLKDTLGACTARRSLREGFDLAWPASELCLPSVARLPCVTLPEQSPSAHVDLRRRGPLPQDRAVRAR